jgi:phosphonate transport system ATP-binding protein
MVSLEVREGTKRFPDGTVALDQVSFRVSPGVGAVLLGHNGSGKSTLLRCISGLEPLTSGQVRLGGSEWLYLKKREQRKMRSQIGMVFQKFHLVGNVSVLQNVLFGSLGKRRVPLTAFAPFASKQDRFKAMECLERVGLSHLAAQRTDTLSGGQQQRVAIARMLMQEPAIVLADEPVASLDPKSGREVMELLWGVVREQGWTLICTLHQLDLAMEYGDQIIALKRGKKVLDCQKEEINEQQLDGLYTDQDEIGGVGSHEQTG